MSNNCPERTSVLPARTVMDNDGHRWLLPIEPNPVLTSLDGQDATELRLLEATRGPLTPDLPDALQDQR